MVQTVLGPVEASKLLHCQPHEHLLVRPGPMTRANPLLLLDSEARSLQELTHYARAGGGSVVDAQPGGAGRDAAALMRLSKRSGVTMIAVTGTHLPAFYPPQHWARQEDEDALAERFIQELTVGMTDNGRRLPIRAGLVKAAIGPGGLDDRSLITLRAAVHAAITGNVSLMLHTAAGFQALKAVNLCVRMGLDASKVAVCHADRQVADVSLHEAIASTGCFLSYDTIARYRYHDDQSEARLILHMLRQGAAAQLMLSMDTTRERLKAYGGSVGLPYILENFLPFLKQHGVSQHDIEIMTHKNPARFLKRK